MSLFGFFSGCTDVRNYIFSFFSFSDCLNFRLVSKEAHALLPFSLLGTHAAQDSSPEGQKLVSRVFAWLHPYDGSAQHFGNNQQNSKDFIDHFFTCSSLVTQQISVALSFCRMMGLIETLPTALAKFVMRNSCKIGREDLEPVWQERGKTQQLTRFTALQELVVENLGTAVMRSENFQFLSQMTTLTKLHMRLRDQVICISENPLVHCQNLTCLRSLSVEIIDSGLFVHPIHSSWFSQLLSLESLFLNNMTFDDTKEVKLKHLTNLTSLTTLNITDSGIFGNHFAPTLARLTNLKALSLTYCLFLEKPDPFIQTLRSMHALTQVTLCIGVLPGSEAYFPSEAEMNLCLGQTKVTKKKVPLSPEFESLAREKIKNTAKDE